MRLSQSFIERFEQKFQQQDGCWLWQSVLDHEGYGKVWYGGTQYRAHRISYKLYVGSPGLLDVHHTCGVRACVNPEHLELKSKGEHTSLHNPRLTHCKRGHALTPENVIVKSTGKRACRTCFNAWRRERRKFQRHAEAEATLGQFDPRCERAMRHWHRSRPAGNTTSATSGLISFQAEASVTGMHRTASGVKTATTQWPGMDAGKALRRSKSQKKRRHLLSVGRDGALRPLPVILKLAPSLVLSPRREVAES
jgi:HNH endonuclease